MDLGHWENCTGLRLIPDDYIGFIYRIDFEDGTYYWGKKKFWSPRYTRKAGQKRRQKHFVEADWRSYQSSSEQVQAKLRDGIGATYKMIAVFTTARTLGYAEDLAIILSGSYEDIEDGINWRLEKVQGKLGMKAQDSSQLNHLKGICNEARNKYEERQTER